LFLFLKVNPYVATFYDAVLLYAYGLNRTIESNQNFSDGFAVVQKMWNVSFEGSNGIVQISETGDRVGDYSLFDLNPKSGQFEVIKYRKFPINRVFFFYRKLELILV
jgi:ABC-type branched-subunit amino acid transport system substrate-binding protein